MLYSEERHVHLTRRTNLREQESNVPYLFGFGAEKLRQALNKH